MAGKRGWGVKARAAALLARRRKGRRAMPKVRHKAGVTATAVGNKRFGSVPPSQRKRKKR